MRNLILSAVIFASAFQIALGEQSGDWTYFVSNNQATITGYTGAGGAVTIPSAVNGFPVTAFGTDWVPYVFGEVNYSVTSLIIPESVKYIGSRAVGNALGLRFVIIYGRPSFNGGYPFDSSISLLYVEDFKIIANNYDFVAALANNDAFVTAVANKIKGTEGNYGIATQSGLSSAITTAVEPLATKSELTSSLAQSRTDGINSVLSNPNLWTLYTTSQIQNMAVGDLVLTRQVSGGFVLNYDIEQSTDLQTWTPYQALSLPLTGLPTDKAFVRIKVINSNSPALPPVVTPTEPSATPVGSNL